MNNELKESTALCSQYKDTIRSLEDENNKIADICSKRKETIKSLESHLQEEKAKTSQEPQNGEVASLLESELQDLSAKLAQKASSNDEPSKTHDHQTQTRLDLWSPEVLKLQGSGC